MLLLFRFVFLTCRNLPTSPLLVCKNKELVVTHCLSLYGCFCGHQIVKRFETAFNNIRNVWKLPLTCHTRIITLCYWSCHNGSLFNTNFVSRSLASERNSIISMGLFFPAWDSFHPRVFGCWFLIGVSGHVVESLSFYLYQACDLVKSEPFFIVLQIGL